MSDRPRILHVFQDTVLDPRYRFLGSTKDIRGRTEYFAARGWRYTEIVAQRRSDGHVLSQLRHLPLEEFGAAIFELALYPRSMAYLRRHAPHVVRLFRPGNAQLLHQLDGMRARRDFHHPVPWMWLAQRTLYDLLCGRLAHAVLSITEWEARHYWRWIVPADRVRFLPYFLPAAYGHSLHAAENKERLCVCVTTAIAGTAFVKHAAGTFVRAVEALNGEYRDWRFAITGDLTGYPLRLPERIEATGFVDDINALLARARAMALLSDLGYGFKTKILDAVAHRCRVLVTGGLYRRLPAGFRPYLVVVDPAAPGSLRQALEQSLEPFPSADLNAALRRSAYGVLDEALAGAAAPS